MAASLLRFAVDAVDASLLCLGADAAATRPSSAWPPQLQDPAAAEAARNLLHGLLRLGVISS
uniref:Uncharacterized protein n=1 Tax=Arundo donax TaxID=35708 RepID=A0A0A9V0U0_ARUDO